MYYREALKLQAFLDMAEDAGSCSWTDIAVFSRCHYVHHLYIDNLISARVCSIVFLHEKFWYIVIDYVDPDILQGYEAAERNNRMSAQLDALSDLKFTYVVSCQMYGTQKSSGDPRANDILDLMVR